MRQGQGKVGWCADVNRNGRWYRLWQQSQRGLLRVCSEGGHGYSSADLLSVPGGGRHGGGRRDVRQIRAEALEVAAHLRL